MTRTFCVAITLYGCAVAAQQRDFSNVEVKVTPVAGNVHVLEGAGGNIGISAGPDGILLVDDQYAPLTPKIEKAIAPLSAKPVRFLLNTHWHGDHTGGNENFGAKMVPILAHTNVRKRLETGATRPDRVIPPAPPLALPVITYEDGISVHFNGEEIRVVHLPAGHTDGDSVVFFTRSGVVHLGDLFFGANFPFIDIDSGGSVKGYISNLETLRAQITAEMKIIPGHGKVSSLAEYDAYLAMLKDTASRVEKGIRQGKTVDQLKKAQVLKGYEGWAWSFISTERFVDMLHRGLERRRAGSGARR